MLLFIEQLATQGLLFFLTLGETIYHSFTNKVVVPAEKEANEELPLWGLHLLSNEPVIEQPMMVDPIVYAPSEMTMEQEAFFQSFLKPIAEYVQEDCTNNASIQLIENDMLTMDAWEENPAPVKVTPRLSAKADSRIVEHKIGEQLWVVEVVGEEQGYLHVSDGSARAWVEAISFGTFDKGDILSIIVDRNEHNQVFAKAVDILQKISTEFAFEESQLSANEQNEDYEYYEDLNSFAS